METLKSIVEALVLDPDMQNLLIDLVMFGLAALGISAAWITRIRIFIARVVPLLVVKIIADRVDSRVRRIKGQRGVRLSTEEIGIEVDNVVEIIAQRALALLPPGSAVTPFIGKFIKREARRVFKRIEAGGPPMRSVANITRGSMRGIAQLKADARSVIGEGGVSFGVPGLGGDDETMHVGANVKYDWRTGSVDWGASIKLVF